MSMRGVRRRGRVAAAVSGRSFAWDPALIATLRHCSLPFDEELAATPLADLEQPGARDRLSLVAQFAAHQALLQFAGIADGELDPAEWAVVVKRGADVRLIRTAARASDASTAPPVLTIVQQFAELIGATLDVLQQSWARADAIYAEAFARLTNGAAADLRWMRRAACGAIAAPGPDGLRTLTGEQGTFACRGGVEAVQRFAQHAILLRGASPLERYSALRALACDAALEPAAVAEQILARTSHAPHVFIVANREAFDAASNQVVELLIGAHHGAWLLPDRGEPLPPARHFVVSPRLTARRALEERIENIEWLERFVDSGAFASYLSDGDVPPPRAFMPALTEPARSYVGALALLGSRIPRELARRFLEEFLFKGDLEDLAVDGVMSVDEEITFANDAVREEAARLIPATSRAAICRVAAAHAHGLQAALLWLDGGEVARAADALEATQWSSAEEAVNALRRLPRTLLTPSVARRYAHALIDCGRYRDARDIAALLEGDEREFVLARAERRTGDYAPALARLERMEQRGIEAELLRAEILRLNERYDDAAKALANRGASIEARYERAILAYDARGEADESWLVPHYLASRYKTYVALQRGEYASAQACARQAHREARCTSERIDASLDGVYAAFCAGEWDRARVNAVEALQEVEETQGDRAAGGILFTLAYLAADNAQWAHASQRIARLRHFYAGTNDELRLRELQLLAAHLDFSRGRFADAARAAQTAYETCSGQIREAAALILDELDWIEGRDAPLRSNGKSGNAELTRRHERIKARDAAPRGEGISERLFTHRRGIDRAKIARELDLVLDATPAPAETELRILRAAALRDFPFAPHDFDLPWCFATRNRLGQWNLIGSHPQLGDGGDWIVCSDRERLYLEGSARWSSEGRDAIAAIFRTRADNHRLRRIVEQEESARPPLPGPIDGLVGDCAAMREVSALVQRIARRDVPVCILGESGTGKELVARAIHRHSARRPKPFTAVNCAALPENLIESELFGHVRGAFTGADRDRAGLIETTDGGTLFLDEIGELPLGAQAKLLRFLQEGEFRRVGDTQNRTADVRIVSATNRKLESAVEEGRFRDDLYYRVRGVEVLMPPLRERGADVLLLATHFLVSEREKHRGGASMFAPDVEAVFAAYSWPGNVRELQNTIRAAHAMAGDGKQIALEHLPERLRAIVPARAPAGSYHDAVSRFKRDLIERSLAEARGNQNRAAGLLRMSRQALAYQIRELGIHIGAATA
jgi:two-component system, NtrC family, response regulator AtoC